MPDSFCTDHSAHVRAIGAHDKRLDKHSERIDGNTERIDGVLTLLERLTLIEEQNSERLDDIDSRLDALEAVPKKRYETLIASLTSLVLGAAFGVLTSYF